MGCCKPNKFLSSETEFSMGELPVLSVLETLDSLLKFDDEEGTGSKEETIKSLLKTFSFDELVSLLKNKENNGALKNSTVETLALVSISNSPSECLEQFVMSSAEWLIHNIEENSELKYYSLKILTKALDNQRVDVKRRLLKANIMTSLVPLMRHSDAPIRLIAAMVCADLYNHCRTGREEFIELHGEQLLIQLVRRDGDTDNSLVLLLECIIDLLYVNTI